MSVRDDERMNWYTAYLDQLTRLHNSSVNVIVEINAVMDAINKELGIEVKQGRK